MNVVLTKQKLSIVIFALYLVLLVWIIVFKLQYSLRVEAYTRDINLLPFYDENVKSASVYIYDKIYNLLFFVPFGVYVNLLKREWTFVRKITPIFLTSVAFEAVQYIFAIGATDINDVIMNTLGGIVGLGVYYVTEKIFRNRSSIIVNAVTLIVICLLVFIRLRLRLRF